uniref:Hcy-binding domain-containing protein n=1 Tax=Phlebotomus papatasi TaxID=29031 RepID=A0A1B0DDM3_PHLPP
MRKMATVIDGGFATQLTQHVGDKVDGDPLWSARFNATNPAAVKAVHVDFLEAGAEIIRTNTYQASIDNYKKHLGISDEDAIALLRSTVGYAQEARDDFLRKTEKDEKPRIFGSIGPYGACLADGSEYSGSYIKSTNPSVIREWHKSRITVILEAGVDGLAIETLPSALEGEILLQLMKEDFPDVKFWLCFQCRSGSETAAGENYGEAMRKIWQIVQGDNKMQEKFLAIGVNCLHPDNVASLFTGLNDPRAPADSQIPLITYPNSGETYDVVKKKWIPGRAQEPLESRLEEWIKLGVRYVGGCCRNYASDIRRIRETLDTLSRQLASTD